MRIDFFRKIPITLARRPFQQHPISVDATLAQRRLLITDWTLEQRRRSEDASVSGLLSLFSFMHVIKIPKPSLSIPRLITATTIVKTYKLF